MSQSAEEIARIQEQMRRVRANLGRDVHDFVENTRAMTDWHLYWKKHPWLWSGIALLAGYFVVPSRRRSETDPHKIDPKEFLKALKDVQAHPAVTPARRVLGELAKVAAGFAAKRGLQILSQRFETAANQTRCEEQSREFSP